MKKHGVLAVCGALILSACAHKPEAPKGPYIPPLSIVAPFITPGMPIQDVEKKLSGNKPVLMYTFEKQGIWELRERNVNPRNNSIQAYRLILKFDSEGKVAKTMPSQCLLPDQETPGKASPGTLCYRRYVLPFDEKVTYEAIKRLLINSNYQIDHSDFQSRIIAATGMQPTKDKEEVMYLKLSINFSSTSNDNTEVVMAANFSVVEKQMVWVQAGAAGVTIPVPLPFQKTEEWADAGLATPKFYLDFYDALSRLIADEYLRYEQPNITTVKQEPTPPPAPAASQQLSIGREDTGNQPKDYDPAVLDGLNGRIDDPTVLKKIRQRETSLETDGQGQDSDLTALPTDITAPIDNPDLLKKIHNRKKSPSKAQVQAGETEASSIEVVETEDDAPPEVEGDAPIDRDISSSKQTSRKSSTKSQKTKKHSKH